MSHLKIVLQWRFFGCLGCAAQFTLYLSTCLPSSESLHPFVNFPLASEVIALLNRHSTVNFTSFHTLWAQKSGHLDRYFSLMRSINRAASVELWQYYHYFKQMQINQMPTREDSQCVFQQLHYN